MKNTIIELPKKEFDLSKNITPELVNKMVDVSEDCKQIQGINPMNVYNIKNEIIKNSDEISDERKLELLDANQDKYIRDNEKSVGILALIKRNKVAVAAVSLYVIFKAGEHFISKAKDDSNAGDDNLEEDRQ